MNDMGQYLDLARRLTKTCYEHDDPADVHAWLLSAVASLRVDVVAELDTLYWEDSFSFYDEVLEKRAADWALPADQRKVFDWPWRSWNRLLDPLPAGMLAVIAAGDGQGKTAYAEMVAEHWARQRVKVAFVHYELSHAVMMDRRYSRHTNLTARELKGVLTPEQRRRVADAHAKLREWEGNITYQHAAGWSMERTLAKCQELQRAGRCDVVVVDYLEKCAASRRQVQLYGTNTWQREADNVELLKSFAEQFEVPAVMLTQMNKAGKASSFEEVGRDGIRGAGEKSEKANVVVLLHRERDKATGEYSKTVSVRVDKNTLGPTGQVEQYMAAEYFKVHDLD